MNGCIAYTTPNGREFIEDSQEEWPSRWPNKIMYYDVLNECRTLDDKQVRKALNFAMTTWDLEIDIIFKPIWGVIGDPTISGPANITLEFRGSDEDNMFKEKPSVLAYAYFPGQGSVSGKVVFNDDYIWSLNGKSIKGKEAKSKGFVVNADDDSNLKTFNLVTVLIHELGHSLGLKHDADIGSDDVMDAFYDGQLDLSPRDIYRILLKHH